MAPKKKPKKADGCQVQHQQEPCDKGPVQAVNVDEGVAVALCKDHYMDFKDIKSIGNRWRWVQRFCPKWYKENGD